ncbi:DNA-3-methyladenine glycosylase family protein [Parvularcula lutaonensis]|uniref:DNA-3-methyladenine glycosylase II n=1 Tax=Parvularcula lutaonensis TaxID=491923 RepID=A0ABV7M8I1_9PROT|nr:DNA-3-methyladenine glycosylase 2 family protein [Parvularcula lutaonensis]GGY41083.1 DNA-3-methyladenine glycosylase II [Parvularcula lutaonensis]
MTGLRGGDRRTAEACRELAARCRVLSNILDVTGPPRWRAREGGYQGLSRIIIEQQLSVASANAILERVQAATAGLDPEHVLRTSEDNLRSLGLSRPKIRYLKVLAADVTEGRFDFAELQRLDDRQASEALEGLLGVGRWTAAVYLLFCEGRRDLWPRGDVALLAAHLMAGGTFGRQDIKAFDAWAEEFYAPHRGVAAHILWGQIAHVRGRAPL